MFYNLWKYFTYLFRVCKKDRKPEYSKKYDLNIFEYNEILDEVILNDDLIEEIYE